ncbi:N-alpha-acetyltransferase 40-like protein [Drosera capensis]
MESASEVDRRTRRSTRRQINMERHYGMKWKVEERVKYREMLAPEARYIFALDTTNAEKRILFPTIDSEDTIVGFVHYHFTMEEEVPVLYLYELQLVPDVQGKGLGEFMMQLLELIARKNRMGAIVLTVQKSNLSAMKLYISRLRCKLK